ncbi:MAG: hypothetical protein JSS49_11675 [Planctomycetes bacterium]|nr:hypothetical protein [Planctomycetota bacterium]
MAEPIEHSHGLPEDGQTVAPQFEKGDRPDFGVRLLKKQHGASPVRCDAPRESCAEGE